MAGSAFAGAGRRPLTTGRRLRLVLGVALWVGAPVAAFAAPPPATGFEQPESAHWDRETDAWYVSNTAGGYVSKLAADGTILEQRWLDGLHGPYGLAAQGGSLFVSDTDRVVVADLATASIRREIPFPDAGLLNDVAVARSGDAYVSDTCAGIVHRIPSGRTRSTVFVALPDEGPNGLALQGKRLVVAGLGSLPGVCGEPTSVGGRVLTVDLKTRAITPVSDRIGALDGLEVDGDRYLVTDFATGRLLAVDAKTGSATLLAPGLPSAADIGFDARAGVVAVPYSFGNAVVFHDV